MSSTYITLYGLWTLGVPSPSATAVKNKNMKFRIPEHVSPKRPARRHGLIKLSPENLLSLVVEVKDTKTNDGYQRALRHQPVAKMMEAINAGAMFPPPICAWDDEIGWVLVDGQHRAMAHALLGKPLTCCMLLDVAIDQRRQLFRDQRKATPISANLQTMNADDSLSKVVQSVFTNNNPALPYWCEMARAGAITPNIMWNCSGLWLTKTDTQTRSTYENCKIDLEKLEMLGSLLREALKSPSAYKKNWRAPRIRAVTKLAVAVWVQTDTPAQEDQAMDRWLKVFPKFDWKDHQHLTRQADILEMLISHVWNKRLKTTSVLYIKK